MSLVGPRPLLVQYLERYSPEQARRHEVLPGITGWAQVNGRNAITWDEKFQAGRLVCGPLVFLAGYPHYFHDSSGKCCRVKGYHSRAARPWMSSWEMKKRNSAKLIHRQRIDVIILQQVHGFLRVIQFPLAQPNQPVTHCHILVIG